MNAIAEVLNPTFLICIIIIILVYVLDFRRILLKLIKQLQDSSGGKPIKPRPRIDHFRTVSIDPQSGRWQLQGVDGGLAPPISVRGGDTVTYQFNLDDENANVHFQYPRGDLFVDFPASVDSSVTVIGSGEKLTLTVSSEISLLDPSVAYAIFIESNTNRDTGYVQGGSPPKIIFEHA